LVHETQADICTIHSVCTAEERRGEERRRGERRGGGERGGGGRGKRRARRAGQLHDITGIGKTSSTTSSTTTTSTTTTSTTTSTTTTTTTTTTTLADVRQPPLLFVFFALPLLPHPHRRYCTDCERTRLR
jgi:hypothetical protein